VAGSVEAALVGGSLAGWARAVLTEAKLAETNTEEIQVAEDRFIDFTLAIALETKLERNCALARCLPTFRLDGYVPRGAGVPP
jgi:hypothetical protein